MKKLICIVLCVVMVAGLCGCDKKTTRDSGSPVKTALKESIVNQNLPENKLFSLRRGESRRGRWGSGGRGGGDFLLVL